MSHMDMDRTPNGNAGPDDQPFESTAMKEVSCSAHLLRLALSLFAHGARRACRCAASPMHHCLVLGLPHSAHGNARLIPAVLSCSPSNAVHVCRLRLWWDA